MTVTLSKHPGPGGSPIHSTGTDQSIHSGGLGVSMGEVSRRKLMVRMDPKRAPEVQKWAMDHIERIRSTTNRHESLAGSTIQRLNNLYYTADYYIEEVLPGLEEGGQLKVKIEKPEDPVFSTASREMDTAWWEITPHGQDIRDEHAERPDEVKEIIERAEIAKAITRTPDYPHGRSIKWPKVYRGLRRRGMDKEKAARISNAMSNKYRGGRRQPLSATAGKKPIPEDILDKRPDLRKNQPSLGSVHVDSIMGNVGNRGKKSPTADERKRRKKKAKKLKYGKRYVLSDRFNKHYGPGPHANGTPQSVHGSWATGTSAPKIQGMGREGGFTVDPRTGATPDSGFAVAIDRKYEDRIPLTGKSEQAVNDAIASHRARVWSLFEEIEGAHWGGWLEDLDGVPTLFLDVSVVTEDLEEAVSLGKRFDQFAIFDLGSFTEIRLDDSGESLSDFISSRVES